MTERSKADEFLIEQIRQGSESGWSQLVQRYHGRLLAFAKSQLRDKSEADDIVQETFIGFLKSVDRFRTQASLETYLFTILRRRLVDSFRRNGRRDEINLCSLQDSSLDSSSGAGFFQPESSDLSASQYVQQGEQREEQEDALWRAIGKAVQRLKDDNRFRDLQIVEMLFYAQLRNKDIGSLLDIDEKQVALVKHRLVKRLANELGSQSSGDIADESMLSRLWEEHRPSCPKRSTVGKWLMGTLEHEWDEYVAFHLEKLGCRFCQANRTDLQIDTEPMESHSARHRIMQSSVGFFRTR
jgi:RNA polymerase sigma factor (sigma-70 family)